MHFVERHHTHTRGVVERAFCRRCGFDLGCLESPKTMPATIEGRSLLSSVGLGSIKVHKGREVFYGSDLQPGANGFVRTEKNTGSLRQVRFCWSHNVMFHTHPAKSFDDREVSARQNIFNAMPRPYWDDMRGILLIPRQICEIVMAHDERVENIGLMVVIKTRSFRGVDCRQVVEWEQGIESEGYPNLVRIVAKLDQLYTYLGFVVYRGFYQRDQEESVILRKKGRVI